MSAAKNGYTERNARYERENLLRVMVKFNRNTEGSLVERVEREPNKAGYIKRLVREDVEREKEQGGEQNADH